MSVSGQQKQIPPKIQDDAVTSTTNPTSGDAYTVLETTKNVRIISIAVAVTWTVQPTPLEVHATIDGVTYKWAVTNPVSGTYYDAVLYPYLAENAGLLSAAGENIVPFLLEARSITISTETTGGTVSNMTARVKYAKY